MQRLRSQLVGMIQDCQDRVLLSYKASRSAASTPAGVSQSLNKYQLPVLGDVGNESIDESSQAGIVATLYNCPPLQTSLASQSETVVAETVAEVQSKHPPSDSGYFSEPPVQLEHFSNGDVGVSESSSSKSQPLTDSPRMAGSNTYNHYPLQEIYMPAGDKCEFQSMWPSLMNLFHSNSMDLTALNFEDWMSLQDKKITKGRQKVSGAH